MAILSLVPALLAGTACTSDLAESLPEVSNTGLAIGFDTGKGGFTTRAMVADDTSLREDYVDHVDVFIFDGQTGQIVPNGTGTCYWRVTAAEMEENQNQTQTLLDGDWKTSPLSGTDYDVYVVANLHGTDNLSDMHSVADLQAKVEKDANVYQAQGGTYGGGTTVQDKLFTMTGMVEGFNPQNIQEDEYVLPVELTRVAAKIQIEVSLSQDFLQNDFAPRSFTQQLKNYAPTAYLLEGQDENHTYEPTSSTGYTPARTSNATEGTATFVLYTYPTEWTADVLRETYVIVNIPGDRKNPPEGEQPYTGSNYYKIPLRAVADAKLLERNHIYRVKATVDMMGTYTPDEPVPLKTVKYEVAEWKTENVDITGDNPRYLILSEEKVIMRNVAEYDKLTFASSSKIVSAQISNVYFVNKFGQHITVSDRQINATYDVDVLNGKLYINSPVPTNKTIRYMTLTVRNEQGETRVVTIEQYPLEYITGIKGWYSYRKDFNNSRYSNPCTYEYEGSGKVSGGNFSSHVFVYDGNDPLGGQVYTYNWNNGGEDGHANVSRRGEGKYNNRMYHVVITATSSEYTIAIPLKETVNYQDGGNRTISIETAANNAQNNTLVSPSFMLASQLGIVTAMSWDNARKHCAMYVEKGENGKVYDDWRLPTAAELKIIGEYQYEYDDILDEVLAGEDYWSAVRGVALTNKSDWWSGGHTIEIDYNHSGSAFIRCVRDCKPDDPLE